MIEMLSLYDYYFSKRFKEWKGMGKSKRKRGGRVKIMYIILMMCTGINLIYSILIALTYCIKGL